jgi:hypothetical protein
MFMQGKNDNSLLHINVNISLKSDRHQIPILTLQNLAELYVPPALTIYNFAFCTQSVGLVVTFMSFSL